jgi:flagella basal body P-ring formation protein FlgA
MDSPRPPAAPARARRIAADAARCLVFAVAWSAAAWGSAVESPADIAAAARAEAARLTEAAAGARIEAGPLDERLRLPECTAPLGARAAQGTQGRSRMTIEVSCPAPAWRVFVPVSISVMERVVVAVRPLAPRTAIAAADIALVERDTATLPYGYFRDVGELAGMELTRPIAAGEAIVPTATRSRTIIHRGQEVTLLARAAGLTVRMRGEALASAGLSQRVRVRNLGSGREVEGIVRSPDVVEVAL